MFQRLKQNHIHTFCVISVFPSAGSIVRLSTHDEVCKIEPAQKGSTVSEALKGVEARIKRDVNFQKEIEVLKENMVSHLTKVID